MNRIIDQIVNHFLGQSGFRIRDLERSILRELLRSQQVQPNTLPTLIQRVSQPFVIDIAADLAESRLAGWIMGMDWVDRLLPKWVREDFQQRFRPDPDPVTISIFDWFRGSGGDGDSLTFTEPLPEPEIRYTIVTNAMQRLAERNILTRDQWDQAAEIAKRDSFTITGDFLTSTIERVRDRMIDDLQSGTSLDGFLDKAGDVLRAGGLSEARIENIYRTNVQGAFRDGRQTIAQDPVVREAFPYQAYVAVHDARARHDHQLLETLGLDGTSVYRADDPFWNSFSPPWDFNSVATGELVTTSRGLVPIEKVAPGDAVLTHLGNWRSVLGCHTAKGPSELVLIQTNVGAMRLTAEHRVFTQNGWVAASSLNVGHKLYQVANPALLDLVVRKVNQGIQPKRFNNRKVANLTGPIGSLELDPQLDFGNIDVKPVWWRWLVENALNTGVSKCIEYQNLVNAWLSKTVNVQQWIDQVCCLSGSYHSSANIGAAKCPVQLIGSGNLRLSTGVTSIVDFLRLASAANLHTSRYHQFTNSAEVHSSLFCDIRKKNIASDVRFNSANEPARPKLIDLILSAISVRNGTSGLLSNHKIPLKTITINRIQRQLYTGLVHDISVEGDESFFVNGHAVSNCRCGVIMLSLEQAANQGVKEAQRWLQTGDAPTVVEHRLTDVLQKVKPNPDFGSRGRQGALVL